MNPFPIDTKARDNTLVVPAKSLSKVLWRNKIISLLDYHSQLHLSLSCKYFHEVFEAHWQDMCKNKWSVTTLEPERTWSQRYGKISGKFIALAAQLDKIKCCKTLKGHPEGILYLQVIVNKMISVSCKRIDHGYPYGPNEKIIKVWALEKFKCLQTIELSAPCIVHFCFPIFGNKIMMGGSAVFDKHIAIWDLETGKRLKTLESHDTHISYLEAVGNTIVSGYKDGAIKIWDLNTNKCLKTLEGHKKSITCLQALGNTVISGSQDGNIKIWDLNTNKCLKTLEFSTLDINCFQVLGDVTIFNSALTKKIHIWDLETNKCLKTLEGHNNDVTGLQVIGNKIISSSMDKTIKIWDIESNPQKECRIF